MYSNVITRNYAIDLLRAFGIGLMIINHVGSSPMSQLIHSFHMPLFFFISGLFFTNNKPFWTFTAKKAKNILIPYLFFAALYYVIWLFWDASIKSWYVPLKYLLWENSVGPRDGMPYAGALWFLTAFFIANVVYFGISRIKSRYLQLIIVLFVVLIGTILPMVLPFRLPYTFDSGLVGVGFIYCGHHFKNSVYYDKLTHLSWPVLIIVSEMLLILISFNGFIDMRLGIYNNEILFWINALGCIVIGINVCNRVISYFERHGLVGEITMGKDGLVFMCVNEAVIALLWSIIPFNDILVSYIVIFILTISICYIVNYIFQHTKLRVLIGKF